MDASGKEGMKAWTPLFFSLVLIFGMVLGFNLRDSLRSKRDINSVIERNDRLEQVIDLVNEKYVDSVKSDVLYKDAISGILKTLDPHTVYIPAEELQDVNDDLEGGFSGIGVEFSIIEDTIQVTSLIDNGPASKGGLQPGDQLIKVGDSVVAGVNITSGRITRMLKGKQKTNVTITIRHYNAQDLQQITLTRDIISVHSVEAEVMLDDNTGYIKIDKFSANTHKEFLDAVKDLKKQGLKQLILDLRENPGGYINEATEIADELLDDNKLIVYTQGVHASKTDYIAEKNGEFEKGKLIVLIDESSASASEILSGSIQDWDRGIIMGRRSFGKGLVQEPYEMTDGSELRLTIARYYTPSGRCIQRPFSNGKEAYEADYEKRFETAALEEKDVFVNVDTTKYFTHNKRIVYGGGGIKPDVFVPYDTLKLPRNLIKVLYGTELKNTIWNYYLKNQQRLKYSDIAAFSAAFEGETEVMKAYLTSLNYNERVIMTRELSKRDVFEIFASHIKAQVARYLFKSNGYFSVMLKDDNMVNTALEYFDSKKYSGIINGK